MKQEKANLTFSGDQDSMTYLLGEGVLRNV